MARVDFYRHSLGHSEVEEIAKTLSGIFLTTGPRTRQFEEWLAGYLGVTEAVGLTSATMALFLAQKALGIGPGDEVITTPMTFIATPNSVLHTGAKPVFVDCDAITGNIDLNQIEAAITPRTKAIIPVHLYGVMVEMRALRRIADKHGLAIIEDCAHCLEGHRDAIRPGQLGDIACFSFYATKNLACGEGGAVAGNNRELLERVRLLRSHGMNKDAINRYTSAYQHWEMVELGYKANMYDLQAALLLPQLGGITTRHARRQKICHRYEEAFSDLEAVDFPRVPINTFSARHLFTIWVDPIRRDIILAGLQHHDIGVAVNYRPVHLLKYYREHFAYRRGMYPNAERIGDATLTLPMYPALDDAQTEAVIAAVRAVLR